MKTLVLAEQLNRRPPGGIGTYISGLASGLHQLYNTGTALDYGAGERNDSGKETKQCPAVQVTMFAGGSSTASYQLSSLGFSVASPKIPLSGAMLTMAWRLGLGGPPEGFDLVHATSLALPPGRTRLVVTVHDLAWRTHPEAFPPRGRRWHEKALQTALSKGSLFIVPSWSTQQALVCAGARADDVVVIEHGSDHLPLECEPYGAMLLSELAVHGPFVLCVGTLEPRKNLVRLMQAWKQARLKLGSDWTLVIVGPAGWGNDLVPNDGVVLGGAVSAQTLAGLYRLATLVAYVPLLEGFGFPAVEAMAAGTAVVASPMPSLGGAALEVDPCSPSSIADGLVEVASDSALRRRLSAAGTERAASLTWKQCAKSHIEAWASVVEEAA